MEVVYLELFPSPWIAPMRTPTQTRDPDRRDRIFYPGDTERPKPCSVKLFLNIALDQKKIFTSPFHANRHNALEWLIPTAITGGPIAADANDHSEATVSH